MLRKTDINGKLLQFASWALATIVFTLVVTIRNRLLGILLERDEGKYAYAGRLILQDIPPYELLVRRSANPCRFITTTNMDYFFGDIPQSVETLKNYILIHRRNL